MLDMWFSHDQQPDIIFWPVAYLSVFARSDEAFNSEDERKYGDLFANVRAVAWLFAFTLHCF